MFSAKRCWLLVLLLGLLLVRESAAQDFRIYTRVYDAGTAENVRPTVIGSSLSLFHAGKVYDHVENEYESEVIIFEPAHQRFTILSTSRSLATTDHFDEIKRKLKLARNVTTDHLDALLAQKPAPAADAIQKIKFPIDPAFKTTHESGANAITCESKFLTYKVRCADVEEPKTTDVYLNYADWTARLNYVLHPHALYPEPRLALNGILRSAGKMPVEVELTSSIGMPIHLRAEHQIHWKLDSTDRSLIHEWESLLKSSNTRQVTFQEYQRSLLVSRSDR
jgi:hypothetical protein